MRIPLYSEDLIKMLDKLYPEKCPSPTEDERRIWMYAGQRELVRNLINALKAQKEEGVGDNAARKI